ncbi:DUF4365 domain-containing protein [Nocardia vulneris]|uniref:DUF4365 domain-containing protein n=1 Tax=Nocardia vulneris TaxID=1141657 RepID=UPI0030D1EA7D
MRASESAVTGAVGENLVAVQFQKLNWGVAPTPQQHDVGTDLLLMPRDSRRWDLKALLGAQVKAGKSRFRSPKVGRDGVVEGWWYAEKDDRHFRYWSEHAVPHILVLHDPRTEVSYWVHVTSAAVVPTGKGAKIFVPADSTVDRDQLDRLVAVAAGVRRNSLWDGSAWQGGRAILHQDRLRHALITPRLIAPHPNLLVRHLEPVEALALLVKMRLRDLDPGRPSETGARRVESCRESTEWGWRFYAAVHDVLLDGADIRAVTELIAQTDHPFERAAACVVAAALHIENKAPAEALALLSKEIDRDECQPVDHAWLLMHQARCHAELGHLPEARLCALAVQSLPHVAPHDPSAMAIVGASFDLIFSTTEWAEKDISGAIAGRDTTAAWWRAQEVAWGLQDQAEKRFERWANPGRTVRRQADTTWMRLRGATLIAGFTGDHGAWKYSISLLAKHILTSDGNSTDDTSNAIWALLICGDSSAIELAVPHLLNIGIVDAVHNAAAKVDLAESTWTSLRADVEMILRAADILTAEQADRHARWALDVLDDSACLDHLAPSFFVESLVLEMLAAVVPSLSGSGLRIVIKHLVDLPRIDDQAIAHEYAHVMANIPDAAWTRLDLDTLAMREQDQFELADQITTVLARHQPSLRAELQGAIARGDQRALHAFGDVRDLDAATVVGLIDSLRESIAQEIRDLRAGTGHVRTHSFAATLVLINVAYPEYADWNPIIALFSLRSPFADQLASPLSALRRWGARVPADVIDQLEPGLRRIMRSLPQLHPLFGERDLRGIASAALAALDPTRISRSDLWELLSGNKDQRAAAVVAVAGQKHADAYDTLVVMSHDPDPWVRGVVANTLTRWITSGIAVADSAALLEEIITSSPSILTAQMVSVLLEDAPQSVYEILADILSDHPSARVRTALATAMRNIGDST